MFALAGLWAKEWRDDITSGGSYATDALNAASNLMYTFLALAIIATSRSRLKTSADPRLRAAVPHERFARTGVPGRPAGIMWGMTLIEEATEPARGSQHRWLVALAAIGIPVASLFSMTVVLVTALTDQVLVSSSADQRSVEFGWPLVWIQQDLSSYDPPFPTHLGLSSPWENPTSMSLGAVLVDVLFVFAVVSAVVLLAAALTTALVRRRLGIRRTV